MPRQSRICYNSKFFHIMVQGINREHIFEKDIYKEKFLEYMYCCSNEKNIKIISYCIMPNHVHIVVYVEEIEMLSKMMSNINTRFAMFYNKMENRCGYVFRDRYKCQNIYTQTHLECCIRYVHNNPVKVGICKNMGDYKYSSYKKYVDKKIGEDIIRLVFKNYDNYIDKLNLKSEEYDFLEIEDELKESKPEKLNKILREYCANAKINSDNLSKNNIYEITKIMKNKYGATKTEIAECLGISRYSLYRILK